MENVTPIFIIQIRLNASLSQKSDFAETINLLDDFVEIIN